MDKLDLEFAASVRRLLRARYVIRSRNGKGFQAIVENRKRIQELVAAIGAFLEVNEPLGVAYLRPESEELEEKIGVRLSRPKILGSFASALLIHLRWHRLQFFLQPTGSEIPVIGILEMREFLHRFSHAKVDSQFERQFRRCLDELSELQVLLETQPGSGTYEITGLCDLLLPADQLLELRTRAAAYFSRVPAADEVNETHEG